MDAAVVRFQALDDDLVFSQKRVDEQRAAYAVAVEDHQNPAVDLRHVRTYVEYLVQLDDRQVVAANVHCAAASHDSFDIRFGRLQRLRDVREWNDEGLIANRHGETVQDRECERQADRDAGSYALGGLDFDAPAHVADVAPDDVHADTAARNVRHDLGRGEARLENELVQLFI